MSRFGWAAVVVLIAGAAACESGPGPITVKKLLVEIEPAAEGKVEREQVRDDLRRLLSQHKSFRLREGASEGAIVRARVFVASEGRAGLAPGVRGAGVDPTATGPSAPHTTLDSQLAKMPPNAQPAMVSLTVTAFGRDRSNQRYQYRGAGVSEVEVPNKGAADVDALTLQALSAAIDEVGLARSAEGLPTDELIARLANPASSASLRRQAVQVLGTRKAKDAVPALQDVLLGDDKELANDALRALTSIGDPRAVDAIITYADGKSTLARKAAINAVKVMGTKKGEAWLFTLSTGHPDPDVQSAAQSALAALSSEPPEGEKVAEKPASSDAPGG